MASTLEEPAAAEYNLWAHASDGASDDDAAKIMILHTGWFHCCSCCYCPRHKFPSIDSAYTYTPVGLRLDPALLRSFLTDLKEIRQLQKGWDFMALWVLLYFLLPLASFHYGILVLVSVVVFSNIWWNVGATDKIESAVKERVQEWRPLFHEHGYAVDCVVDKPNWMATKEVYLYIHRHCDDPEQQQQPQEVSNFQDDEGVKYMYACAWELSCRNKAFRSLANKRSFLKPPYLRRLDDDVFQEVIKDVASSAQPSNCHVLSCIFLFLVLLIPIYYAADTWWIVDKLWVFSADLILCYIVDRLVLSQCCGNHELLLPKLELWQSRLAAHGYTLSYHVDQPQWWSWKETYIQIKKSQATIHST